MSFFEFFMLFTSLFIPVAAVRFILFGYKSLLDLLKMLRKFSHFIDNLDVANITKKEVSKYNSYIKNIDEAFNDWLFKSSIPFSVRKRLFENYYVIKVYANLNLFNNQD